VAIDHVGNCSDGDTGQFADIFDGRSSHKMEETCVIGGNPA
jgi:hypothetical protein